MSDKIELLIPPHADVRVLCDQLHKMQHGLRAMGLDAPALDRAMDMLTRQSWEIYNSRMGDLTNLGAKK